MGVRNQKERADGMKALAETRTGGGAVGWYPHSIGITGSVRLSSKTGTSQIVSNLLSSYLHGPNKAYAVR
ncbi:hypothetical protein CPAR01_01427 [Colletotrichum paranaense]|uniref:Penicillin-binding protein n=1 Tax=Colletotrichum paranaense TaxID=1914294 RepID=A0ABQ9T739_9PEZI|nr:uncharacterized protein CPAR01_01427 [Colletotrichum paranaense]KAK1547460.1 hypothetical protein CPAR01_01427 [Colletotrichum paranaense]